MSGSLGSVTVLIKEKPKAAGKKILIPPNMASFRSKAAKALNLPADKPIQNVYTSDFQIIKSVNDIEPNSKVYVSTEVDDNNLKSSAQITQNLLAQPNPNRAPVFSQGFSQNHSVLSFNTSTSSIQSPSRFQNLSALRPPSILQSLAGSRSPSSLMILSNDPNESPSRLRRRKGGQDYSQLEISQFQEEDNDKKRFEKTGISHREIETILSFLPREVLFPPDGTQLIVKNISQLTARFGSNIKNIQQIQDAYFFKNIQENLLRIPPHSKELDDRAIQIVNEATFDTPNLTYIKFKAAIVGPHQSGKSTFLQILASKTLLRMISSGQLKRTFFLLFDFKKIMAKSNNAIQFFNNFVKITFEQISRQRLLLQPYCEMLISHFQRIASTDAIPILPQKFTLSDDFHQASIVLNELTNSLYNCLYKSHSLQHFITNVVMIPHFVAAAFGFKGIHFVIDHIDKTDIEFQPNSPLDDVKNSINLLEFIKFMISSESFVISCIDEEKIMGELSLQTNNGVDLLDGINFISIADIDLNHENSFVFDIECEGISDPIIFSLDDCGGCSGFTTRWDELIEIAKDIEQELSKSSQSTKAKEAKLYLIKRLREFVPLVLKIFDQETLSLTPLTNKVIDFKIHSPSDKKKENPDDVLKLNQAPPA